MNRTTEHQTQLNRQQVQWMLRTNLDQVRYQYERGGIGQAAYEAYLHVWQTSSPRGSSLGINDHGSLIEDVGPWLDLFAERGAPCCLHVWTESDGFVNRTPYAEAVA